MRDVSDATFDRDVLGSERPVVVDFWAPWCRPCHAIESHLQQLEAQSGGRVEFVRLNVDDNPGVASRYGVLSLPTVIAFAGGAERETVVGARPRAAFERLVAALL